MLQSLEGYRFDLYIVLLSAAGVVIENDVNQETKFNSRSKCESMGHGTESDSKRGANEAKAPYYDSRQAVVGNMVPFQFRIFGHKDPSPGLARRSDSFHAATAVGG